MKDSILTKAERKLYIKRKRARLQNRNPSVIASNCNGGIILHDLGLQFNTPTVNLFFFPKDFLQFVSDLDHYLSLKLEEANTVENYPVGILGGIYIHFLHYKSFSEAEKKWEERKRRVDKNNLFLMMTDRDGCTYDDLKTFDALPYRNKVVFTHKPYPEIVSAVYIKGFEEEEEIGVLSEWKPGFLKRRYLDSFDFVSFFNKTEVST